MLKKHFFVLLNILSVLLCAFVLMSYLKYSVLTDQDLWCLFKDNHGAFQMGRFPARCVTIFFYKILPGLTGLHANDIHNTWCAAFKVLTISLIAFIYMKCFYIGDDSGKKTFEHMSFGILYPVIFFLLLLHTGLKLPSWVFIHESTRFFDYTFNLLFYSFFICFLGNLFCKNILPSIPAIIFSVICAFVLGISNEFCVLGAGFFLILIILTQCCSFIYNKNFYFSKISIMLLNGVFLGLGGIVYFLFSNYSSLTSAAGHQVNWYDNFLSLKDNILPFFAEYKKLVLQYNSDCLILIAVLFLLIILFLIKHKNSNVKTFLVGISSLLSVLFVIFSLIILGRTVFYGNEFGFWLIHPDFRYMGTNMLLLSTILFFGSAFSIISDKIIRPVVFAIASSLIVFTYIFFIIPDTVKTYKYDTLRYLSNRKLLYKADKISLGFLTYDKIIMLPVSYYKIGMMNAGFFKPRAVVVTPEGQLLYDNIIKSEIKSSKSRLFSFKDNNTDYDSDNDYLMYLHYNYGISDAVLIFVDNKLTYNELVKRGISFKQGELKKLRFSDIKKKNIDIIELKKLLALKPYESWIYASLANYSFNTKDYSSADRYYTKAIMLNDYDGLYYALRGNFYTRLHLYDKVIKDYSCFLKTNPLSLEYWEKSAAIKIRLKNYKGAEYDFGKAAAIFPFGTSYRQINYYFERAKVREHLKDYKGVINDLDTTIKIQPAFFSEGLYLKRANAKRNIKDYKGAVKDYTEELLLSPDLYDIFYLRGACYIGLKKYNYAFDDFISYLSEIDISNLKNETYIQNIRKYFNKYKNKIIDKDKIELLRELLLKYNTEYN